MFNRIKDFFCHLGSLIGLPCEAPTALPVAALPGWPWRGIVLNHSDDHAEHGASPADITELVQSLGAQCNTFELRPALDRYSRGVTPQPSPALLRPCGSPANLSAIRTNGDLLVALLADEAALAGCTAQIRAIGTLQAPAPAT